MLKSCSCPPPESPCRANIVPCILQTAFSLAAFLVSCLSVLLPSHICHAQTPPSAAYQKAHRPNLELSIYRRSYSPEEKVTLRLSVFNTNRVEFRAYPLDLAPLIPTSKALETFRKRIAGVAIAGRKPAAHWTLKLGKVYPNNWQEEEADVPKLPPGIYLITASSGGVEKRTWFAVTDVALLAKRSRQELLVYATRAGAGRPVPNLALTGVDATGKRIQGATNAQGLWRIGQEADRGSLWISGTANDRGHNDTNEAGKTGRQSRLRSLTHTLTHGSPAFLLSGAPPPPEPFAVYTVTDRPIYRPGHTVSYKSTIRQRLESDAPGGFVYRPFANKSAIVEIRDATDALVARRTVMANAQGSLDGTFQLAPEPTLGRWQLIIIIGSYRAYSAFEVQAYRKPEFTFNAKAGAAHYTGGETVPITLDAQYFFGQPVAGATVRYSLTFQAARPAYPDAPMGTEPAFEGQGVTDAKGQLVLQVKTQRLPVNRRLILRATLTDLSRRSANTEVTVLIVSGRFRVTVTAEKTVYKPGEIVRALVRTEDYDGKPISAKVRVVLAETRYDRNRRPYKENTNRDITTDASGQGVALFTPPRPGYLALTATAFDAEDNKIASVGSVWVSGDNVEGYDYPTLSLVADKTNFAPGETATILLNTSLVTPRGKDKKTGKQEDKKRKGRNAKAQSQDPEAQTYSEAWALITIEGERLYATQLVPLTGRTTILRVPLAARYFPSVEVNATLVQNRQIYSQGVHLSVARQEQKLRVTVTADKEKYAPGETATYTLTTRNAQGKPVPAEIGMGVVDASIYSIRSDETPDIEGFFWGGQEVRIQTDFSFAAQYSGGAAQTVKAAPKDEPGPAGPQPPAIRIRKQFADTAYWNPFILTGADGTATARFTLPDNLTTWRATARGLTAATAVGTATRDTVVTMPLLVRLELPRFYVQGDSATVSAIVHNYTGETRQVKTHIVSAGANLEGDADRVLDLAPGAQQRLDWQAKITQQAAGSADPNAPRPTLSSVRFTVIADGGPGGQDATELTLPVKEDGLKAVDAQADALTDPNGAFEQNLANLPPNATLTLTLAPSLSASIFDALDYLTSYPYGCAEQTMSSFLPDVVVARGLKRLNQTQVHRPNLDKWVNLGLQKLYRYQHGDGGWNWWEFDQTDGDMTAYVLWGLVVARDSGYLVDEPRIQRGSEALLRLLNAEREWNRRADYLLTLAYARAPKLMPLLTDAYDKRDKLDTYGLASLALALANAGQRSKAETLAHEIEAKATVRGTTTFWSATEGGYSWRSDDAFVTAHALRALLAVMPYSKQIPPVVRWLMGNRTGKAWDSTRTSAEVVFALTAYMEATRELAPNYTARVLLDGQPVQQRTFAPGTPLNTPTLVTLTPDMLRGHTRLTVEKAGPGTLYLTSTTNYLVPAAEAKAIKKGLAVRRTYTVRAEDPSQASSVASGEDMEVQVELTADADYRYAMLEEPIPAGCEVAPGDEQGRPSDLFFEEGSGGYVRQEVRDDRVVFFFDSLPKGHTRLSYRLHAETPGVYRILPGIGSLVYFPEIRGNSLPVRARIGERQP